MSKPKILELEGKVLYENSDGANNNMTLNETIVNFNEVKIDYSVIIGSYTVSNSIRVPIKNGESVLLNTIIAHSDTLTVFNNARYLIDNTSVTKQYETDFRIGAGNTVNWTGTTSKTKITKITGYNIKKGV